MDRKLLDLRSNSVGFYRSPGSCFEAVIALRNLRALRCSEVARHTGSRALRLRAPTAPGATQPTGAPGARGAAARARCLPPLRAPLACVRALKECAPQSSSQTRHGSGREGLMSGENRKALRLQHTMMEKLLSELSEYAPEVLGRITLGAISSERKSTTTT